MCSFKAGTEPVGARWEDYQKMNVVAPAVSSGGGNGEGDNGVGEKASSAGEGTDAGVALQSKRGSVGERLAKKGRHAKRVHLPLPYLNPKTQNLSQTPLYIYWVERLTSPPCPLFSVLDVRVGLGREGSPPCWGS
jgi:hypothetical protein